MCVFAVAMPHLYQTIFLICVIHSHCRSINHSLIESFKLSTNCSFYVNIFLFYHRHWNVCNLVLKHYTTWNFEHAHTSHHYFEISKSSSQINPVFESTRRPLTIQFTVYPGLRADLIIWCTFVSHKHRLIKWFWVCEISFDI